ncbi:MAG: DUF6152 family protein [Gammaproteobacteria bacterium]
MKKFVALGALVLPAVPAAYAHHSSAAVYDRESVVETEGDITEIQWVNPHVRFKVRASGADGRERVWDIESNSVSIVSRFGLTPDLVKVGTHVKIAGNGGRVRDDIMWINNMLLPSGEEILFGSGIPARWSQRTIGTDTRTAVATDASGKLGLFRVWTNTTNPPTFWGDAKALPLTPAAAATRAAFDPVKNDPTRNCAPKGMPYVMEQPYPIEFVQRGDVIELRLEEYDTVRRIALSPAAAVQARNETRVGASTGRFDGKTLIVETRGADYRFLNSSGIPVSGATRYDERFTLSADGSRLEYTLTVTDPATFTAPVTLHKAWEWRPGEQVKSYDCKR